LSNLDVWCLAIAQNEPRTLYLGAPYSSDFQGVFKTTDAGQPWTRSGAPGRILFVTIDPKDSRTVYAGITFDGKIVKTTGGGANWSERAGLSITALAIDPRDPQRIYAGLDKFSVWLSDDGARSWH